MKKHADWSDYVVSDGDAMNPKQVFNLSKVLNIDLADAGAEDNVIGAFESYSLDNLNAPDRAIRIIDASASASSNRFAKFSPSDVQIESVSKALTGRNDGA